MKIDHYETTIEGGNHWSYIARRGTQLTLTDIKGQANVGMLFYNPYLLNERFNAPDTLKCQHTFKLTKGHCLYSDMGRIFCSIIEDSFGWHESVCGNCHAEHVEKKWGKRNYQTDQNNWHQNGYDSFLVELAKYQLPPNALAANINWFSEVRADNQGNLLLTRQSKANDFVSLRFEMDTLVLLHSCPHPLNKSENYPQRPVKLEMCIAAPLHDDDLCMNARPENKRGFMNNAIYHLGC